MVQHMKNQNHLNDTYHPVIEVPLEEEHQTSIHIQAEIGPITVQTPDRKKKTP